MFENVPNNYRPIPFWSWNEKLNPAETRRQIEEMNKVGIGGFFMHARGGLQTEYMSEEWFDNISESIVAAKELGMYAWAYDENGWPSGFGNGLVNGKGEAYQQKYLRFEPYDGKEKDHTIAVVDNIRFFYEINPFYVDVLDRKVAEEFINEIYEPYYKRFGNDLTGFFTDEPQISRDGIPWSLIIPNEYQAEYGEDICPHLIELFKPVGDFKKTRMRFWRLVTALFSKNFMKPIYDWCKSHKLEFTGHLVCEETFKGQLTCNGAVMPHYEYFTMPGMDCLGRGIIFDLTSYQVGSAAQQLGKKQVLSETFALCGHNVSFNELKAIYQHQMMHGVNLLCQHLEGYSLRGIRKRDYPPAMYYQQPWWSRYKVFCDSMSRIGMLLADGKCECDTLLIHPQTSAWILFDNDKNEGLEELYQDFKNIVNTLDNKHISFHLGDETLLERHGKVNGCKLIVGEMEYSTVIIPPHIDFFDNTKALLDAFKKNGGRVIGPDDIKDNTEVVNNPEIIYTKRIYDGFDVYYLINISDKPQSAVIKKGSKIIDISTGKQIDFCGEYTFAEYESLLVIDDGQPQKELCKNELKALDLSGEWSIASCSHNILTLDYCDYYFDGKLEEENGYVLNIQNHACALKRPVNIKQEYNVNIEELPQELFLVCETPKIFDIKINQIPISMPDTSDWVIDTAFKRIDILPYLKVGKNTITLETRFHQSQKVYESLEKALIFETEKNKLTYDVEIEPCYLMGDFGIKTDGSFEKLDRDASRFSGSFTIVRKPEKIKLSEIEKQGFPFFAGSIELVRDYELKDTDYCAEFMPKGVNVIEVFANDKAAEPLLWAPYKADISKHLVKGKNTLRIKITNNLRNMMGPHHLNEGESYFVCPSSFFKEPCVWGSLSDWGGVSGWNDDYCFAEVSLI